MKRFILSTTLAVAAFAGATSASATVLDFNGFAGHGSVSVLGDGPDYSGQGGAFRMGDATNALGFGNDFVAFCLDLTGTVRTGFDYVVNNVNPYQPGRELSALQRQNVENLYDASYGLVDVNNNIDAAAFQLALWEAGYETATGALDLLSGTRVGSAGSAILARANEFLANMLTWDGSNNFNVSFLDASVDARQDLVTATPVPVPAAGLLLLTGLGGIAALRRRRRKT